jgi:hypothetical protein
MASHSRDENLDLERVRAEEELKPFEEKLLGILHDLLQPGPIIEAADAAAKINELFPLYEDDSEAPVDENDPAADPDAFLWSLWGLIIQVMRLVPPQHPGQIRMTCFLQALGKIPTRTLDIWGVSKDLPGCRNFRKLTSITERAEALVRFPYSSPLLEGPFGV